MKSKTSRLRSGSAALTFAIIGGIAGTAGVIAQITGNRIEKERKERVCIDDHQTLMDSASRDGLTRDDKLTANDVGLVEPCISLIYCESKGDEGFWSELKLSKYSHDSILIGIEADSAAIIKQVNLIDSSSKIFDIQLLYPLIGKKLQINPLPTGVMTVKIATDSQGHISSAIKIGYLTALSGKQLNYKEINAPEASAGNRSPQSILTVIRRNIGKFQAKYQEVLLEVPDLSGKISIKFTIGPSGKVIASKILSSQTECPALDRALLGIARDMEFEQIPSGNVTVTYSFVLDKN